MKDTRRWIVVIVYAIAMAWVEAAVVFYLRTMIDRIEPYQPNPLPIVGGFGAVEMVREAATLLMLLMVGILAGRTWQGCLGYAAIAFGVWDIFYYVFLKIMCHWPHSLFDWDILFLLPLPWWGPVLAPISIALLMVLWGTVTSQFEPSTSRAGWKSWALNSLGVGMALYLFMADALRVADRGVDSLRNLLPSRFNWFLFSLAVLLMTAPLLQLFPFRRATGLLMPAPRQPKVGPNSDRAKQPVHRLITPGQSSAPDKAHDNLAAAEGTHRQEAD